MPVRMFARKGDEQRPRDDLPGIDRRLGDDQVSIEAGIGQSFDCVGKRQHYGFAISLRMLSGGMLSRTIVFCATCAKTGAAVSEPQMEAEGRSSQT